MRDLVVVIRFLRIFALRGQVELINILINCLCTPKGPMASWTLQSPDHLSPFSKDSSDLLAGAATTVSAKRSNTPSIKRNTFPAGVSDAALTRCSLLSASISPGLLFDLYSWKTTLAFYSGLACLYENYHVLIQEVSHSGFKELIRPQLAGFHEDPCLFQMPFTFRVEGAP